jgi:hypothetical protein
MQYPIIVTLLCAQLFFLLTRSSDILIACKKDVQRTKEERLRIKNGLTRSLFLEAILFVPASVVLFRLAFFPIIYDKVLQINQNIVLWHAIIGIVSYGFPFAAIRQFVQIIALKTLQEFADISLKIKEKQ